MPIKIPHSLPAKEVLESENIFVMDEARAVSQDIRPLKISILNLMPTKVVTETQLLRLLSNTPLQVDITLLNTASHRSKNTAAEHLETFYKTFSSIEKEKYDGLIITGAPVERLDFADVDYWDELCAIMEWSKTHVYTSLYVCWGAFAGLYYNHGIDKHPLEQKLSGVFRHRTRLPAHPLLRGFNETFCAPHSRYSYVNQSDIESNPALLLLSDSPEAGVYIAASVDGREVYITGHPEYDTDTLRLEYLRDRAIDPATPPPQHYFPENNPALPPANTWKAHAHLLYSNWLNYFVYPSTPADLELL